MKRIISVLLAALLLCGCTAALADSESSSRAVIGADLSNSEIQQVYDIFGIDRGDVKELTVTNADEREYLEGLVSDSLIGTRAISCIFIESLDEGDGMSVSVKNISWCTSDMYINAMVTAGISDANVIFAAPFSVSGTAALTGIYKAYEDITGEKLDATAKLVGTQELTTTAELADEIGSADSTAIVNELKLILDKTKDMSDEELRQEIIGIAAKYDVELTDSQLDKLIELCRAMEKLDTTQLKEKVEQAQQYLKDAISDSGRVAEFFHNIGDSISDVIDAIIGFFQRLFGIADE
ncbi:MAG: DUF1002 domain-containing protein [Bacillota bacterium]|nr:DUF1002 domain-containing protein [Bacillota bacterium]